MKKFERKFTRWLATLSLVIAGLSSVVLFATMEELKRNVHDALEEARGFYIDEDYTSEEVAGSGWIQNSFWIEDTLICFTRAPKQDFRIFSSTSPKTELWGIGVTIQAGVQKASNKTAQTKFGTIKIDDQDPKNITWKKSAEKESLNEWRAPVDLDLLADMLNGSEMEVWISEEIKTTIVLDGITPAFEELGWCRDRYQHNSSPSPVGEET